MTLSQLRSPFDPPTPARGIELVSMIGVTKRFGGAPVVSQADLHLRAGSVHALLGPNGAGKSTMIKILSGTYQADSGTITTLARDGGPNATIGFVHQNLAVVEGLNVRENIFLTSASRLGILDRKSERSDAAAYLSDVGAQLDPEASLDRLSLGERTFVAMARLRSKDIDVMVLDETSAALSRRESDWLYQEAKRFAADGGAVLVVTHRLAEVTKHCDEVTVMADGQVVFNGPTPTLADIHRMMSAGVIDEPTTPCTIDESSVVVSLVGAASEQVGPIDLEVRAGEVVALVGPLSSSLYGIGHLVAGHAKRKAGKVRRSGSVALVPENCHTQALLPNLTVRENMSLSRVRQFRGPAGLSRRAEEAKVSSQMLALDVVPPDAEVPVEQLSGGNQQKVILARAALTDPRCYVLCEPTRGVDIKTRHAIYRFIRDVSKTGAAVLVITIDVDDAFAVAHRIGLVRAGGRIESLRERDQISPEQILEEVDS